MVEGDVFGLDIEVTPVRHGLPGIHVEVEEHLPYPALVYFHCPQVLFILPVNPDLLFRASEHPVLMIDESIQVSGLDLVLASHCKPKEIPGQIGGTPDIFLDSFQVFIVGMGRALVHHHQ